MIAHPSGAATVSETGSCLCPSTYMKSDGPFQLACAVSSTENVPDIGAFAKTRYATRILRAAPGVTRQREPLTLVHRIGLPSLAVTANCCTFLAKSSFA